ncbi:hypothetical protein HAV15_012703 [Penicillium sp. str. |nr:hypothetical protein HAV15_012703 [Penicillium sp. str. \
MPLMVRYPKIKPGTVCSDIVCNVDFAPTFLDFAGITMPTYMQGRTFRSILGGKCPADWDQLAYHRYWMHNDAEHEAYAHYGVRNHRYKLVIGTMTICSSTGAARRRGLSNGVI